MTELAQVFDHNLNSLRERDPDLAERLANPSAEDGWEEVSLLPSRSGHLTARVTRNGQTLFVHSSVNPITEAQQWAAAQDIPEDACVILLGLGLGYPALSLYNRLRNGRLIVVEPSPAMARAALHNPGLTELLTKPDVTLLVGPWRPALANRLWNLIYAQEVEKIRVVDYHPRSRLEPEIFANLTRQVTDLIRSVVVNNNTLRFFAGRWARNLLANLPVALDHPPATLLFEQFRKLPAIIVAAGPSLSRNVALLAQARDRALILAVGTALKPLLKAGILPHMVITVDGGEVNFHHFRDVRVSGIPLLYDVTCYPEIPRHWQGPCFTLSSSPWFSAWVGRYLDNPFAPYKAGPSVSNGALDVATRMGCDPIIFVGLDLGYTGGQSHAEGSTYVRSLAELQRQRHLVQVPGWHGEPVWTDSSLLFMLQWFETWLANANGTPLVIDATEGGVRKQGMQPMPLRDALSRYATRTIDIPGRLNEIVAAWAGRKREQVEELCQAMGKARQRLRRMAARARVGEMLAGTLEQAVLQKNQSQVQQLLRRLERVDRGLRVTAELDQLVALALHPVTEFLKKVDATPSRENWEILVSRKSQLLYKGIVSTAESLVTWLAKSEAEIRERFSLTARQSTGGVV